MTNSIQQYKMQNIDQQINENNMILQLGKKMGNGIMR